MIRRRTVVAFIITLLVALLSLTTVNLASAHPASHLASHLASHPGAKKRPTITIASFTFIVPRKVVPGATIKVVNKDVSAHTVTATGGAFDVAVPGESTVKFRAPKTTGKYAFVCIYHGSMQATLVVR
jgi:plastocyanin